jgi:hypothetical protein
VSSLAAVVIFAMVASAAPWPPAHTPGWQEYWSTRRIVTIAAYRSSRDVLDSTVVLDNAGRPAAADSVRRLTARALAKRGGDPVEYVQVALDSSARSFPGRQGIPEFVARRLSSGHFREWISALDPQNPKRAMDGFIAQAVDTLIAPGIKNALKGPLVDDKAARGLLAASPDSTYILDPFAEVEISSAGAAMYDADDGYGVFDAKNGDILAWNVGTSFGFNLGAWIDRDRYILLGTVRMDNPVRIPKDFLYVVVPTITVGDMKRRVAVSYLGRPLDYRQGERLGRVQSAAYPRVKW